MTGWRRRALYTGAAMLLGAATCAHSCGPTPPSVGDGETPYKALCTDMKEGAGCRTLNDTTCEIVGLPNQACNTIMKCDKATQTWTRRAPLHTGCAVECPADFDARAVDKPCNVENAGTLICSYFEGTCGCAQVGDAGDAGAPVYEWRCIKTSPGCGWSRPAIGGDCFGDASCDYGDCTFPDGVRLRCSNDEWVIEDACP